jgi:hypothetical protein
MACSSSVTYPAKGVWTMKSTSTWMFHPVSEAISSVGINQIRASFSLEQSTGVIKVRPALQMSNDGLSWDTPVAIGAATRNTDGTTFGSDYADLSATTQAKLYVRFGVQAQNDSGTDVEMGRVTLRIDHTA